VITLPTPSSSTYLSGLIVASSSLTAIPGNLCAYVYLSTLDLSLNRISTSIDSTTFSCLTILTSLDLSGNALTTIAAGSFDALNLLVELDLSSNQISSIPTFLFASSDLTQRKLRNLKYLHLQNNRIKELDPWYFYLESILYIDLSNNQIANFTNNLGFFVTNGLISPALKKLNYFNLQNNSIKQFDDHVLGNFKAYLS
jgi:Leucine-rich repeat (LRR) protein